MKKAITAEYKQLKGFKQVDAMYEYVKEARNQPTFGVHFFLVRVNLDNTTVDSKMIFLGATKRTS